MLLDIRHPNYRHDPYNPAPVSFITTADNFDAQGYPGRFDTVNLVTFVITPTYFGSVQI